MTKSLIKSKQPAPTPRAGPARSPAFKITKLARLAALLQDAEGASLAELCTATGWQAHSVRGALAGAQKHKGHAITSEKIDGVRHYSTKVRDCGSVGSSPRGRGTQFFPLGG